MKLFKPFLQSGMILILSISLNAQDVLTNDSVNKIKTENIKFKYSQLIIPSALMAYGAIGLENDQLKLYNELIKEEVTKDIDDKFTIDDFSQYAPALTVYSLNLIGLKGKNNFRERTIILGTSYLLTASSVYGIKHLTKVVRPDSSNLNSFPSGHTTIAFASAEFLWQEYKDVSIWYGISGYLVAAATGAFRIFNDKHWLTDVAAGAGIGILNTKIAYWLLPFFDNHLFKSKKNISSAMVTPIYNGKQMGLGLVLNLK